MRRSSSRARSRSLAKASELALVAPQVIALRSLQAVAAGDKPGVRERRELTRMSAEKVDAFSRSIAAMNGQWLRASFELPLALAGQWWNLWLQSWTTVPFGRLPRSRELERYWERSAWRAFDAGVGPVHATATANLRRLSRRKR